MKILVDNGCYERGNIGDIAMLKVACFRFLELWPNAQIFVVTDAPTTVKAYIPHALPVNSADKAALQRPFSIIGKLKAIVPGRFHSFVLRFEIMLRSSFPNLALKWRRMVFRQDADEIRRAQLFLDLVKSVDLVVITGGGSITDVFYYQAISTLELLILGKIQGKIVCALGQGLGPIKDKTVWHLAQRALRLCDLIALREGIDGPRLTSALGAHPDRVMITGDDAIEPAFMNRPIAIGGSIGVNIRLHGYSGLTPDHFSALRSAIRKFASEVNGDIKVIPIAFNDDYDDIQSTCDMLGLDHDLSWPVPRVDDVIRTIASCRIVITGGYHAAVFALSQGISAVALICSSYYSSKFGGLSHQFGGRMGIVDLRTPGWEQSMQAVLQNVWSNAEDARDDLIAAAQRQVTESYRAYRLVKDIVERKAFPLV